MEAVKVNEEEVVVVVEMKIEAAGMDGRRIGECCQEGEYRMEGGNYEAKDEAAVESGGSSNGGSLAYAVVWHLPFRNACFTSKI